MRICLYARVSKALQQNPENQFEPLLSWIIASKNEQVKDKEHNLGIFVDEISSKDTRPKKEEVLKLMRIGVADGVCFVALDRWGRTMSELILELEEFSQTNKAIISLKEGIDLSTAAGRLMANMMAAFANFERDRIKERTLLGLARAKAQGKRLGRHPKDCLCGKCGKKKTSPANPNIFIEDKPNIKQTEV
jgi:DNA invertase Pin-like site-specific DNA recombinase